jgi:hypothetical protein
MDLMPYVEQLRRELVMAAEASGGDDARALAERLTAPLESAVRLTLLEALSVATAEITRELAPGSVHLRLRGREPDFVMTPAPAEPPPEGQPPTGPADPPQETPAGEAGGTSRINLRLPDDVKTRVEEAAGRERISVNAWLVRAAVAALRPGRAAGPGAGGGHRASSGGQSFTGWAR